MKLKSIIRQFFNQEPVTDTRRIRIDRLYNGMKRHPAFFIWGIWTVYLGFDVLTRITSDLSFASVRIIVLNYLGGGIFNQYWFFVYLPNLLYLKKWKLISFLFLLLFTGFIGLKLFLLETNLPPSYLPGFAVKELVRIFQFLIYTTAFWALIEGIKNEIEKNRLEVEFEKLHINHVSLQLSPHFVLNVISSYSASILALSQPLYKDLSHFTNLLSYSYKDPQLPNFLHEELGAIEEYIICQRRRFGPKFNFFVSKNFDITDCGKYPVPKWTLMTFMENVFKHGNCFMPNLPCILSMRMGLASHNKRLFTFAITNVIEPSPPLKSTKFGIDAVDRVLNYHFIDHYQLFISKTGLEFSLLINIEYEGKFTDWVA